MKWPFLFVIHMHSHSYLGTAQKIIGSYDGSLPLSAWLKNYFRGEKKFGSRDRKEIAHACFCYYRLGKAFEHLPFEQRLLASLFLCSGSSKILAELRPEWNASLDCPEEEKINLLGASSGIDRLFPFPGELSTEIDKRGFERSFLVQPDLYLRIRPGQKQRVLDKLQQAGIPFRLTGEDGLGLSNQSRVDELVDLDREAVVQDLNSQRTLDLLVGAAATAGRPLSAWDCCAASGGKSLLLHDRLPEVALTVSDLRPSILLNLRNRFRKAGILRYQSFVADVSAPDLTLKKKFDLVICDAPCSGSGTWSRTPEQLGFFPEEKIGYYAGLQKKIVSNAARALAMGGWFLYITCSVFRKENEEVVDYMERQLPLRLLEAQYLRGYDRKADTLYVALFSARA